MHLRWIVWLAPMLAAASCVLDFGKFEGDSAQSGSGPGSGGSGGMIPVTCTNGDQDGGETDVDCGGECPGCANGGTCIQYSDCQSMFCSGGTCAACSNAGDCTPAPNTWCDPMVSGGSCVPLKMNGEPCTSPTECVAASCADGVCCDTACSGVCESCTSATSAGESGTCSPIVGATDPDNECADTTVCNGSGACAALCGLEPTPPGGNCPMICNGGCASNQCVIDCGAQSCNGQMVDCPAGFSCLVQCTAGSSCQNATINCPEGYTCDVQCAGTSACRNTTVNCSPTGTCDMACNTSTQVCRDADLVCGGNRCTATCTGSVAPNVVCGTSCMCTTC